MRDLSDREMIVKIYEKVQNLEDQNREQSRKLEKHSDELNQLGLELKLEVNTLQVEMKTQVESQARRSGTIWGTVSGIITGLATLIAGYFIQNK